MEKSIYSGGKKTEYLVCGGGQKTAFQRRVSSAEHDPVFLSVGRYNLSVSVSLTMWWTCVAVNYKSLYCLRRLCSVDCWNVDVGNINVNNILKAQPKALSHRVSYTNTAQMYMMSPIAESQSCALSKKGGAWMSQCFQVMKTFIVFCHVTTKALFVLETDHRGSSPYRDRECLCTRYFKELTITG